jgi:hypothetical protein
MRWIRRGVVLCILVLAGLLVRDVIRSAERVRQLENDYTELAYRHANQDLALAECREQTQSAKRMAQNPPHPPFAKGGKGGFQAGRR